MLDLAQVFEGFPLVLSYPREEKSITKAVKRIPRNSAPRDSNIIFSHEIYRIKAEDDLLLQLKARVTLYGNEKNDQE